MKPIILELTTAEATALVNFLDAAVRAVGLKAVDDAYALKQKLAAALKAAEAQPTPDAQ